MTPETFRELSKIVGLLILATFIIGGFLFWVLEPKKYRILKKVNKYNKTELFYPQYKWICFWIKFEDRWALGWEVFGSLCDARKYLYEEIDRKIERLEEKKAKKQGCIKEKISFP